MVNRSNPQVEAAATKVYTLGTLRLSPKILERGPFVLFQVWGRRPR